jgi:hypothetical protein
MGDIIFDVGGNTGVEARRLRALYPYGKLQYSPSGFSV